VNCGQFSRSEFWPTSIDVHSGIYFAILVGFGALIALICILIVIRLQRRASLGKQIYEDGPYTHIAKQGTPTMGGIAFPIAALLSFVGGAFPLPFAHLTVILAGAIGFTDDLTSLRNRRALGLRARWKLVLLLGLALFVAATSYNFHAVNCDTGDIWGGQYQWWLGSLIKLPGIIYWPLAALAVVGSANAVNLTDGVDGLAAGTVLAPLVVLTVLGLSGTGLIVGGALIVFLFFNLHPAKVFMGDTGSLALGALLAVLAIDGHVLLYLPLLGIVFVVEALSVIAQVISFKLTGKRIFKMSPLHHHFELSGWSERKIAATFSAISVLASAAFCAIFYYTTLRIPPH
jgi:phospho-N-acetylmuramoyl-pentapeptide-transferase